MFQRELLRIAFIAAGGFVLGLLCANHFGKPILMLIGPLYVLGTVYGIRQILSLLGGVSKAGFFSASFRPTGCLFTTLFTILGFILVLILGWIVGLIVMGKVLYTAQSTDAAIRQATHEDPSSASTWSNDSTTSSRSTLPDRTNNPHDDEWGDY